MIKQHILTYESNVDTPWGLHYSAQLAVFNLVPLSQKTRGHFIGCKGEGELELIVQLAYTVWLGGANLETRRCADLV